MFQIRCWYNKGLDDQNKVEHIATRCSNCGKENGLYMTSMNTNYKDITTTFVFNTVLHHVVMSRIIKTSKHLEYDIDKHNSGFMTGGHWYNTFIYKNNMDKCLKSLL